MLIQRSFWLWTGLLAASAGLVGLALLSQFPSTLFPSWVAETMIADTNGLHAGVQCGPESLWVAACRLGVPIERKDLDFIRLSRTSGCSLADLRDASRKLGLDAQFERLGWKELTELNTCAILWIGGKHFITVDLRESSNNFGSEHIRAYDPIENSIARWWSREKLEQSWGGEALVIRVRPPSVTPPDARIAWETCWQDNGRIPDSASAIFEIDYSNLGSKPLTIAVVGKSCSCTAADVSALELLPGESGTITASVDLTGKRGRFVESISVGSNDPTRSESRIILSGVAVSRRNLLSTSEMHLGIAIPGQTIEKSLFIHDPGDGQLNVGDVSLVDSNTDVPIKDPPRCQVSVEQVDSGSPLVGEIGRFPVLPGDYIVHLRFIVPANCGPCDWTGKLKVSTNVEIAPLLTTDLACRILPDIEARPAVILLSDHRRFADVRIVSHTGTELTLDRFSIVGDLPIDVITPKVQNIDQIYLKAELRSSSEIEFREGSILVALREGGSVNIPVVVLSDR
ncbi:MAG: DUF1573 domain-containing protein [Planctomycetaceae bacterium]|nr:DUF1573 domain-containing protein [Planctomycetaceae bacterium]